MRHSFLRNFLDGVDRGLVGGRSKHEQSMRKVDWVWYSGRIRFTSISLSGITIASVGLGHGRLDDKSDLKKEMTE